MARFSPCRVSCMCGEEWNCKNYFRAVLSLDHHRKRCPLTRSVGADIDTMNIGTSTFIHAPRSAPALLFDVSPMTPTQKLSNASTVISKEKTGKVWQSTLHSAIYHPEKGEPLRKNTQTLPSGGFDNGNTQGEENDMLPQPSQGAGRTQGDSGARGRRRPPTVPFLTVENLTEEPKKAKILAVQTANVGRFNDLVVKVAMGGTSYFMGLKTNNPNYEILFNKLGDKENDWVGREFLIGLEWNEFYEKNFATITEVLPDEKEGKKKAK